MVLPRSCRSCALLLGDERDARTGRSARSIRRGRSIPSPALRPAAATTSSRASMRRTCRKTSASPRIVENKPGAGAIVATEHVSKAAPDGDTLLIGASGMAINESLYAKLPYYFVPRFRRDFGARVVPIAFDRQRLSPIKSVPEFVAYAKANADKMNYATSSATFQLVTELFKQKTGAPMQAIPYKSANEMVLAVVSGQVAATIADAGRCRRRSRPAPCARWQSPHRSGRRFAGRTDHEGVRRRRRRHHLDGGFCAEGDATRNRRKLEGEFMKIARLPDVASRPKAIGVDVVGTSSAEFDRASSSPRSPAGATSSSFGQHRDRSIRFERDLIGTPGPTPPDHARALFGIAICRITVAIAATTISSSSAPRPTKKVQLVPPSARLASGFEAVAPRRPGGPRPTPARPAEQQRLGAEPARDQPETPAPGRSGGSRQARRAVAGRSANRASGRNRMKA